MGLSRGFRLVVMLGMTFSFFLVEIIFGYISHSVALVADSFHMLSDVLALLIAFGCMKIAQRSTQKNTFGWVRAEVLGALINGVFLLALCFSIFIESITRLVEPEMIKEPQNVLLVGVIGLVINVIGMMLFHSHAGHSHVSRKRSAGDEEKLTGDGNAETATKSTIDKVETKHLIASYQDRAMALAELGAAEDSARATIVNTKGSKTKKGKHAHGSHARGDSLNMQGVFLHIVSDALGSLIVIATALVAWLVTGYDWLKLYMDPFLSMIMVCLMVFTTFPLVRETALILLQTTPKFIKLEKLKDELLKVDGILAVHEFHVWRLVGERVIATVHIRFASLRHYASAGEQIRSLFHRNNIHSATIQPEFSEMDSTSGPYMECKLNCTPNNCHLSESGVTCCRAKPSLDLQVDLKSVATSTAAAITLEDVVSGEVEEDEAEE